MKIYLPIICLTTLLAVAYPACDALGQSRSSGNSSMFSGGSSFGSGSSSFGGARGGGGGQPSQLGNGLGNRGSFGRSGMGGTSFGGAQGVGRPGQNLGFGGGSGVGAADQNFVGRSAGDVSSFFNMINPQTGGAMGGAGAGMSRGAMNRGRGVNTTEDVRPPVRVNVQLGFEPPTMEPAQLDADTAVRLNDMISTRSLGDARIEVRDRVATISGVVESESRRLVLERLARLEPGVTQVNDRTELRGETVQAGELPVPTDATDRTTPGLTDGE